MPRLSTDCRDLAGQQMDLGYQIPTAALNHIWPKWGSLSYRNLELVHTYNYRYIKVSVQCLQKEHQSPSDWRNVVFLSIENTPEIVTGSFGIHFRILQLREKVYTSSLEVNPLQSKITDCNSRPLLGLRNWSNKGPFTAAVEQLDVKPQTHMSFHLNPSQCTCFRVSCLFR